MMDLATIKEANENPEAFRKQRDKLSLDNEITNLESRLRILKAMKEDESKD